MEMNVHAPQSLQTRNELIQLASVPTQIITPKDSKPIISIVQDVALGVYRISKSFITITEKQMMNLMCPNPRFSGILPQPAMVEGKIKMWSGRQALSSTLPSNANFKGSNNSYDDKNGEDKENYVIIESGEIKQGRLDTKVYQDRTKGLVHSIFNEYGPEETRHFFDNTQQLICNWLVLNGFSVGISDLVVDNATNQSLDKIIHDMKVKVYDVIRDIHMKKFNNESILSDHDKFEEDVNKLLNDAIQQAGKVGLEKIDDVNNRMINMIKAGAKGNTVNISQMIACLGQQNIDGKRVAYGFESRTLPHYTKYDDGPEARGFVESSFIKGLTPQEFFFHSMGGREGLIDTAVKTSQTGYIQRKLVKAMEDCKVSYDMTVRNANGNIIQFLYGEDGIDAIKIESQPLHYISMTMDKMENEYMISSKDDLSAALLPHVLDELHRSHPNWQDRVLAHYKQLHEDRDFFINRLFRGVQENNIMYPVSFTRIINNTLVLRQRFGMGKILTDMSPIFVLDEVQRLCNEVRVSPNNKGTKLFEMLARMYLSPKQVIFRHCLDKASFKQIIQQIKMRFYDSIVHPSEMVGVVAAQSIGEPLSQCTLNTFHLSGVGAASKATRGVPRIEELTRVTKNVKAPSVTIFFKPEHAQNKNVCLAVKNKLETTTFKNIIKTSKIFFDPSDTETTISSDAQVVEMYRDFQIENNCDRATAPWLLRLELDKQKMLEVGLTTIELNHALKNQFNNRISCIFSDDNAEDVIFRIKLYEDVSEEPTDMLTDLKALESTILDNIILKGVEKLQSVALEKEKKVLYNPDTRAFEKTFEYKLYTEGTNLIQVLCLPYIDETRTVSNDVNEIYKIFGIEAARQCLYNEIQAVITDAKVNVNYRHLALLVDTMTSKGTLMSIDRHGINKGDIGPLAKCSFEEVNDVLVKAGVFSEIDRVNGVSANIMLGQIAPCGTGDTDILIDESKLLPPLERATPVKLRMNDEDDGLTYARDMVCQANNFEMNFAMPEIDTSITRKRTVRVV
jgi:DNA-directed RNA polymerase II subunit RPB1